MTSNTEARNRRKAKMSRFRQRPKASEYIEHLDADHATLPVVLHCRVSSLPQKTDGNLQDQIDQALGYLADLGITPIKVFPCVESANIRGDRFVLEEAIEYARRHGAILAAQSRDRFIRSAAFYPGKTWDVEPPTTDEFEELIRMARGVRLATILHPDDPEVRSKQIKRGQTSKNRRGGRPRKNKPGYKKHLRDQLKPRAIEMRQRGMSLREIERALGPRHSTIQGWVEGVRFFAA